MIDAAAAAEALATEELGPQPHAHPTDSHAKDDLKTEPDAPFCNGIETQDVGPNSEQPAAKVGAMDDIAVDGDATTTRVASIGELCHKHHALNAEGGATVDVVIDHFAASMKDNKSNNKGSYDSIFTLTHVERVAIYASNIQSQNLLFF